MAVIVMVDDIDQGKDVDDNSDIKSISLIKLCLN